MSVYSVVLLSSFILPFILSFDNKLQFYKKWKFIVPCILITGIFYIFCDYYLTKIGVWGFNPLYHSKNLVINLPVEELLFFFVIPYASVFIHYSAILYFPGWHLNLIATKILSYSVLAISIAVIALNFHRIYTVYAFTLLIISILLSFNTNIELIKKFYITFLFILFPFLIVNGILTGSFLNMVVVWYNDSQNLGIRILTMPVEDFAYAFGLILFNLLFYEWVCGRKL